jgi:hypothetical protein
LIIILGVSGTTLTNTAQDFFCSQESIDHGESLIGTAPRADVWFLLEYHGRWGKKALAESEIPDRIKTHLNTQLKAIPESRLLLIKQPREENVRGLAFFAAIPTADPPTLYRFQLNEYEDLLSYDLAAIASQKAEFDDNLSREPVFVNCTNGLRDQCCALHGVATYWALQNQFPGKVWESTHHGGHRFAANFMHLPHGLSYGRLRKENAASVLEAGLDGRIAMDHFRGRTIFDGPVQAAEILLRKKLGSDAIDAVRVTAFEAAAPDRWQVNFIANNSEHSLVVQKRETGEQIHVSCGDEKTSPVIEYEWID